MHTYKKIFASTLILFSSLFVATIYFSVILEQTVYATEADNAFFDACKKGDVETIKRFLDQGVNIESKNRLGNTALAISSIQGQIEAVKLLIDKGANVNATDPSNRTPIMAASRNGNFEIVKILIESGADLNLKGTILEQTALGYACGKGHLEIVKLLLESGADINLEGKSGHSALYDACTNGQLEVARFLVNYYPKIKSNKEMLNRAFAGSCAHKNPEQILEFLLSLGADINNFGGDTNGLMLASLNGITETVQFLLNRNASINATDDLGYTALMHATRYNRLTTMEILLKNGANPDLKNLRGQTALSLAENEDAIALLKKYMKAEVILTPTNLDFYHALPYDKRLSMGLELAFRQYYRLLTKQPGVLVSINISTTQLNITQYKVVYKVDIKEKKETYEVILSNQARDITKNLEELKKTIMAFSKNNQATLKKLKNGAPDYKTFRKDIETLIYHFDYLDLFNALELINKNLFSGSIGPEGLNSASEIFAWAAFFKNTNQNRELSDFLAMQAVCYYLLGSLSGSSPEYESFYKGLLLLCMDYPASALSAFKNKSGIERLLSSYIKCDLKAMEDFLKDPSANQKLLSYLLPRVYDNSGQADSSEDELQSLIMNYPDFLMAKEYALINGDLGLVRSNIEPYLEELINKHLDIIDKFVEIEEPDNDWGLETLIKKEVTEENKLQKWLNIHKIIVTRIHRLKNNNHLIDTESLKKILSEDVFNALLIYYNLEADRLAIESEAVEIADMVRLIYPNSTLANVLLFRERKDWSGMKELLKTLSIESANKFLIKNLIDSNFLNHPQKIDFLKAYREKENPDSTGLYRMFEFYEQMFYRSVAINCLENGIEVAPHNYTYYEKMLKYEKGKDYVEKGKKSMGEIYGFLIALGDWSFKQGDKKDAISYYQVAINNNPVESKAYMKLGEIYHKEKEYDKAIEKWSEYLKYDDQTLSAVSFQNAIGNALLEKGDYSKAYDVFLEAKESWHAQALLGFAEASEKTGKILQAEEYFRKAAERYTGGSCPYMLGLFYLRQNKISSACQVFNESIRFNDDDTYLYYLADHYSQKGSANKAIEVLKKVEDIPDDRLPARLMSLAEVYAYKGLYNNALEILEPYAMQPKDSIYVNLYLLYIKKGKIGDPDKILNNFIKKNSYKPIMYWNLANDCLRKCMFDNAMKLLIATIKNDKAIAHKDTRKNVIQYLAGTWCIVGGDQKTKNDIKNCLKEFNQDKWLTSFVIFLIGDMDEKTILEKASTQEQRADVYYYLGVLKNNIGDKDEALKCLLIYLEARNEYHIPFSHAYDLAKEIAS